MAYSESLAARVRQALHGQRRVTEKRMFGGVGFLLCGNMLVGIWKSSLIARLGVEQADAAKLQPHVRDFDVTGRPMKGWVMIEPEGLENDAQLRAWLAQAVEFVGTLPRK